MTENNEREAFLAWDKEIYALPEYCYHPSDDGQGWSHLHVEARWQAWQASAAARQAPAVQTEPVAYRYKYLDVHGREVWSFNPSCIGVLETQPLYATPPAVDVDAIAQPVPPAIASLLLMQEDYLLAARIAEGYKPDACPPLMQPLAGLLYAIIAQPLPAQTATKGAL